MIYWGTSKGLVINYGKGAAKREEGGQVVLPLQKLVGGGGGG